MSDLQQLLLDYQPDNDYEAACKQKMLLLLQEKGDAAFERSCSPAHFTASGWLLNKDGSKAMLMHHAKLDMWIQPGGHADGDPDLLAVAVKEAQEESGIKGIVPVAAQIFDLDIHPIGTHGAQAGHEHYDVRFLLQVSSDEPLCANNESLALQWFGLNEVWPTEKWSVVRMKNKWSSLR